MRYATHVRRFSSSGTSTSALKPPIPPSARLPTNHPPIRLLLRFSFRSAFFPARTVPSLQSELHPTSRAHCPASPTRTPPDIPPGPSSIPDSSSSFYFFLPLLPPSFLLFFLPLPLPFVSLPPLFSFFPFFPSSSFFLPPFFSPLPPSTQLSTPQPTNTDSRRQPPISTGTPHFAPNHETGAASTPEPFAILGLFSIFA